MELNDSGRPEYEILVNLAQTVGQMDAKLTFLVVRDTDHESRIRRMEKWRWSLPGAGLIATALGIFSVFLR